MLIKWNGDGILGLPQVAVKKDGNGKGQDLYTDMGTVVVIVPGWNEIKEEEWQLAYPHIKALLTNNEIEFYAKKVADDKTGEVLYVGQTLDDVRADKAREIVTGCFNVANLTVWQENMKLVTEVRNLVDKQLDACLKGEAPKKK